MGILGMSVMLSQPVFYPGLLQAADANPGELAPDKLSPEALSLDVELLEFLVQFSDAEGDLLDMAIEEESHLPQRQNINEHRQEQR